jgi:hypothetical protein
MKTRMLVIITFLVFSAMIITESYSNDEKTYVATENEKLYGTWIGATKDDRAKLILNPDGTDEAYFTDSVEPGRNATFIIIDKWTDSDGNLWYKQKVQIEKSIIGYRLSKISSDGSMMEIVYSFLGDCPTEINPNHYNYESYYRQE